MPELVGMLAARITSPGGLALIFFASILIASYSIGRRRKRKNGDME